MLENGRLDIPPNPERKLALRLEIEFENINSLLWDVGEVELIMDKERSIKKPYLCQKDESYSTGHIKAARKIFQMLQKLRQKKLADAKVMAPANNTNGAAPTPQAVVPIVKG